MTLAAARRGVPLVEDAIAAMIRGGRAEMSIPAPEPVPDDVLAALELAEGVPLTPSLRTWLAFDGAFIGRACRWFRDPAPPAMTPLPFHALIYKHLSKKHASRFTDVLPAKLEGALMLPLTKGSKTLVMLALVPGPDGEYPALYLTLDDDVELGIAAPGFDVWLASMAGVVGNVEGTYGAEVAAAGEYFLGTTKAYQELFPVELLSMRSESGTYEETVLGVIAEAEGRSRALAERWKPARGTKKPKKSAPVLSEAKLAEALAQAIYGKRAAQSRALLEDAKTRFPGGSGWKDAAIAMGQRYHHTACAVERMPRRLSEALGRCKWPIPDREMIEAALANKGPAR